MLKEYLKTKLKIRPEYVLSAVFLCFIFYVGMAALPKFLVNTGNTLQGQHDVRSYIKQTNDQYSVMLEAGFQYAPLQDKGTYINLNGLMAKFLHQPMLNERVLLKNGLLAAVSPTGPDDTALRSAADNLISFCKTHQENGGHFLFAIAPSKINKYENVLPVGYSDTDNETVDRFFALLAEGGVPILDLRETLHNSEIQWEDAFFVTDHHWTPQMGFTAFREITQRLTDIGAAEAVDPFYTNENNYTYHTFSNNFLGSAGKRTGIYYAGIDDSIFIAPNFTTDIKISIPEWQLELQGTYQDVSYQYSEMDIENPDYFNENMYGLYGWGDRALTHWRNDHAPVEERLLLIGDSFGNIPFSLMSICYSSCDEIDLRYFHDNFKDYYQNYQPETVVFLINSNASVSEFTVHPFLTDKD